MKQTAEKKKDKTKWLILLLALITAIAVGVSIWALVFREPAKDTLAPDYAPVEEEKNAEDMGEEAGEKLEQPEGGGAVSLSYSMDVSIDLSEKEVTLMFANPAESNQDMVLQIVIQETEVAQSGRLVPGKQVTKLTLSDDAKLQAGTYEGKFVASYYQQDSGEKAILNTEIPVTITVQE